jgi:alkylation response protein AidB-like acyl-CoA dehydrogenase
VAGLDQDTLEMTLNAIADFAAHELPEKLLIDLDERDEYPADIVKRMCSEDLGVQLLFIPEEHGGMGGSAFDVYRVCECMAGIDLGVATSVLATFLGSDPIVVGGTPDQQARWLGRIAAEGILMAYGATEPEAGSDLGAMKTVAVPVTDDNGAVTAYRITGKKQWISNGGVADLYTILASAPGGPSWFVVDRDTPGFAMGKPENKHGIRLSNTAALFLDEVEVPADRLVGGVEGQGLVQAQLVFGYTRLMVAAFGLGAGWAALDRAIPYSIERIQGGGPLSEKQGYTHKLIVPHAVRLEAARAFIEETAERLDEVHIGLNTEGAIAKYLATEAGNAAADAAIQALGGYGYTHEYLVEKIKRDVRITTIYEGTSEIMEMTIARDRWQQHLKTSGRYYHDAAQALEELAARHPSVGADIAALAHHALAEVLEWARVGRLTRNQHVLFRLGELAALTEGAAALARRAAKAADEELAEKASNRFSPEALAAMARVFAREAALKTATDGMRWVLAGGGVGDENLDRLENGLGLAAVYRAQGGLLDDLDLVADALYGRPNTGVQK